MATRSGWISRFRRVYSGSFRAYWFVSFSFGETLPLWVVAGGACLAPLVGWLLWQAVRRLPEWLAVVLAVAEEELSGTHSVRHHLFLPYSAIDRLLMPSMGWADKPTHVLQLSEFRAR